ncbi:MAG: flagellar hook-basal body complex protein, partial [Rhodospirillaceae bacterium]
SQVTSQIQFYDSLGNSRTLQITYQKVPVPAVIAAPFQAGDANAWEVINASIPGVSDGVFGTTDLQVPITAGTMITFTNKGAINNITTVAGGPAATNAVLNVPWGNALFPPGSVAPQPITLDVGAVATATTPASGSTQYAGTALEVRSVLDVTGQSPGSFQKANIDNNGYVVFSYTNGQQLKPYRIPLVSFSDATKLDRVTGAVFSGNDTLAGKPVVRWAGTGDTGTIVPGSLENSNVDIGDELTKMIMAQRAYSSNGKTITTADEMIQEALGLKR